MDSQVALSVRQCGVDLVLSTKTKGGYRREDGVHVPMTWHDRYNAAASSLDQIDAARRRLAYAMTPPQQDQAIGWLAELSVITARRMDDEMTEDLRAAAYSRRLSEFPADIARHALLVHRWKFFPTWAELAEVCEAMMDARKRIEVALHLAEQKLRDEELRKSALPDKNSKVLTPEEKRERNKRLDELVAGLRMNLSAEEAQRKDEADKIEAEADDRRERAWQMAQDPEA